MDTRLSDPTAIQPECCIFGHDFEFHESRQTGQDSSGQAAFKIGSDITIA
jgi:hypothetical protein